MTIVGFDGARNEKPLLVLHEIVEEDKGPQLAFGGLKSPSPIDTKGAKVSPLHVIFNLKGVLVGKDYFRINHLLPPTFNLIQIHTLLSKSVVPRLNVKEFLLRCLK